MNCVEIRGIRCYAHHGCMDEETTIGGYFEVDVLLYCNFKPSALNDDLTKTINYVTVNEIVETEMAKPYKLIETAGYRILERCQSSFSILTKTRIEIRKINPPIDGDVNYVAVVIEE